MTLKFYQYGSDRLTATLELDEAQSSIIERINEPTRLSATLTSTTAPTLQLGARTTYEGITYYVTKEPTVRKEHSKLYVIETELETVIGLARHVILDNPVDKRVTFDYTASATEHLQLVIDSLNGKKLSNVPAWTRGATHCANKTKHIKYDGISAWDALQLIRQTYETDLHIDGTAIDLGISSDKAEAIELAYGKDNGILSGLERLKHDDTPTPLCLYVTGTKRNMPQGRLTLERSQRLKVTDMGTIQRNPTDLEGQIYATDHTGQCIADYSADNVFDALYTEAVYINEEIYPSHVSTIKSVTKVKDHFEVNSDFDYTSLRIEGEQMQVVFQTGNLAGRDFDARHYPSTGRLAIVPKEEDDTTLPNDTLRPKVGDQYIVTGIKLPDQYIREAQRKLTDEALRHLIKLQETRYSYKADIDPVYLHNHKTTIGNKLDVGQYVHLTDPQIAVGDPYIRIIAKRTYLDRPHTPEIELSNEVERLSLFERLIRDTEGIRIDTEEMRDRLRNSGIALDSLTLTSTDISERLKTAEESVSTVNNSLTALASTLLDPNTGEIYKLTSQLDKHKTDTDKSFDDLATHPLTVDKDGYWRIWNLKEQQYVTTEYQSRGRDGQDGAKGADGEDGHTPEIHVGSDYYLYVDGVKQQYLRGEPGHSPSPEEVVGTSAFAERLSAKIEESEKIKTLAAGVDDAILIAQNNARNIDQVAGLASHALGASEAAVAQVDTVKTDVTDLTTKLGEVETKADNGLAEVNNLGLSVSHINSEVQTAKKDISSLNTITTDLSNRSLTASQRDDVAYLTNALQVLRSAGNNTLEGLALQRLIALSGNGKDISAYLASDTAGAVLKAGITNFGTANEREQVEITHAGTGHFGNLYFAGDTIDFRTGQNTAPYLSVGAEEATFIENFLASARVDKTSVSISSTTLTSGNAYTLERTFSVANDGTSITISIDSVKAEAYAPSRVYLTLDDNVIDTWWGAVKLNFVHLPDGTVYGDPTNVPYEASDLIYNRTLSKGTHRLKVYIAQPKSDSKATLTGLQLRQRYDTGLQQSLLTKSGLRLFGSPDRYLDVDYRTQYWPNSGLYQGWINNIYTLRVKGGAKIDRLTADELDVPGVPLCGVSFDESGAQIKAFGKYANRQGQTRAQAVYDYGMAAFKVYHSIGHTNYLPIVQVSGWVSDDINWALTPRVYNITSEYFVVRILTNGDNPKQKAISYVAYKTQ